MSSGADPSSPSSPTSAPSGSDQTHEASSSGQLAQEGGGQKQAAPFKMPTAEEMAMQEVMNNCAVRSVISGVMGGGMGVMMGMLLGALEQPVHVDDMTVRQQLVHGVKQMASRSWHSAKMFALMGSVFSLSECIAEKARAKHDAVNTLAAGCITGGVLSARAGPQAACMGCAGFATFSLLIEKVLERYH